MKTRKRYTILFFLSFLLIFNSFFENIAYAERVYGTGARLGADFYKTHKYRDETVIPPLAYSWSNSISGVIANKGALITNYRIYYGQNNQLFAVNNQTGESESSRANYVVGNPFKVASNAGNITSPIDLNNNGTYIVYGTDQARVSKVSGIGLNDRQGTQSVTSTGNLYGGAIKDILAYSNYHIVATSLSRLHFIDSPSMTRKWWFDVTSGGSFTGITAINTNNSDFIVVTDHGLDLGYGYIYNKAHLNSGGPINPNYTITYKAGIPKEVSVDITTRYIYSVDREGRIYQHDSTGKQLNITYVGDSSTRGYDSVGGVALDENYVYASTLASSGGTKGAITRFTKSNLSSKVNYIHNAPITTTPILLKGLLYFGDSNGKVWALNPSTMKLVNWYLDTNYTSPVQSYDIGGRVESLLGADNHLIAFSNSMIFAFKGRPDFYVDSVTDSNNNSLNGKRFNFTTSTLPTIPIKMTIGNKGTFDYNIYNDFGGVNHQYSTLAIKNLDSNQNVTINNSNFTLPSSFYEKYRSESEPINKQYFQVPANGEKAQLSYSFKPTTEGKYSITAYVNKNSEQLEFDNTNNTYVSTIDVVDMRKPTASSNKTTYNVGETVNFTLSKTQTYSYSSFDFEIKYPNGTTSLLKNNQSSFANFSFTNTTQVGTYSYRISINNRYGDQIYSDWKTFNVVNEPPVAGFNFNKTKYYKNETINITSTAKDPNGDTITYRYEITSPNGTKTTSTVKNPSFKATLTGTYTVKQTVTDIHGATDTITKTQWVQSLPTANFTTDKTEYVRQETVKITGSGSDEDGGFVNFEYKITSPSGNIISKIGQNPTFFVTEVGTYSITLTVTDNEGDTATVTKTIKVVNQPPKAGFNFDKTKYYKNETIRIVNSASDPDGDSLSYTYEVTKPSGAKSTYTTSSPSFKANEVGTYTVKQTVKDSFNATTSVTKTQWVQSLPTANFTTDKTEYVRQETVKITGSGSDEDGGTVTYQYKIFSPSGKVTSKTGQNPTFVVTEVGTYEITLTVTDNEGDTATVTKTIKVVNQPPKAGFNFDKTKYYKNETIRIVNSASDPDGDSLYYIYEVTKPSGVKSTYATSSPSFNANEVGTYTVKQTVIDSFDATASVTKTQWVQSLPTANFTTDKTEYVRQETVKITGSGSDEDGGTVTYQYKITSPSGKVISKTGQNPTFVVTEVGTYSITLTVTDNEGDTATVTKTIKVVNQPPKAGFNFDKTKYYKNETIRIVNSASDPDGDSLSYTYEVTKPSGAKSTYTTSSPSFKANEVGTYTVKQTVKDSFNATASVTKTQWVQSLPTANFTTDKTEYVRQETVKITGSGSDEDGGYVTYQYKITSPSGKVITLTEQSPTFKVTEVGFYTIVQTVTDDEGDTATLTKKIEVVNQPPKAGFNFDKTKYYKNETIRIVNSASDPDGDSLSYTYEVTKPSGAKSTYTTSSPSFKANEVGTYTVKQTVKDSFNATASVTKTQWVQSLPTANFTTDKTEYVRQETVKITGYGSDEDGGTVTYQYKITSPSGKVITLTEQNPTFKVTEVGFYTIVQTVTDDEGDTATLTKKIEVKNRLPIADFSFDKAKYYEGDIVNVTGNSSDPDGDPIAYKYKITTPTGNVVEYTTPNFAYKVQEVGKYIFTLTVTDLPYNESTSKTKELIVYALEINGEVFHTPDWEAIHNEKEHPSNFFYSGEKFLLGATVTDHPIESVKVEFKGIQVNDVELNIGKVLTSNHPYYYGEIFDSKMSTPTTKLQNGNVYFLFTAKWRNGTVKHDLVTVRIIDDVYDVFELYRTN